MPSLKILCFDYDFEYLFKSLRSEVELVGPRLEDSVAVLKKGARDFHILSLVTGSVILAHLIWL